MIEIHMYECDYPDCPRSDPKDVCESTGWQKVYLPTTGSLQRTYHFCPEHKQAQFNQQTLSWDRTREPWQRKYIQDLER